MQAKDAKNRKKDGQAKKPKPAVIKDALPDDFEALLKGKKPPKVFDRPEPPEDAKPLKG